LKTPAFRSDLPDKEAGLTLISRSSYRSKTGAFIRYSVKKMADERVVLRMLDGKTIKGYLKDFTELSDLISLVEDGTGKTLTLPIRSLKAIFFVKSFEGNPDYREKKHYRGLHRKKRRIYVRFKDRETLLGYVEGNIPWEKGFFLSGNTSGKKGFFMIPADEESNNRRIFVVASAVDDVTLA
jgi:small nuclear ribonucleoprotein (snRNP)-like protein